MRIGFVVNDLATEVPTYTTTRLALTATQMGHKAWFMGVGDFTYEPDGSLSARVRADRVEAVQVARALPLRRPGRRMASRSSRGWRTSTWSCCATTLPTTPSTEHGR